MDEVAGADSQGRQLTEVEVNQAFQHLLLETQAVVAISPSQDDLVHNMRSVMTQGQYSFEKLFLLAFKLKLPVDRYIPHMGQEQILAKAKKTSLRPNVRSSRHIRSQLNMMGVSSPRSIYQQLDNATPQARYSTRSGGRVMGVGNAGVATTQPFDMHSNDSQSGKPRIRFVHSKQRQSNQQSHASAYSGDVHSQPTDQQPHHNQQSQSQPHLQQQPQQPQQQQPPRPKKKVGAYQAADHIARDFADLHTKNTKSPKTIRDIDYSTHIATRFNDEKKGGIVDLANLEYEDALTASSLLCTAATAKHIRQEVYTQGITLAKLVEKFIPFLDDVMTGYSQLSDVKHLQSLLYRYNPLEDSHDGSPTSTNHHQPHHHNHHQQQPSNQDSGQYDAIEGPHHGDDGDNNSNVNLTSFTNPDYDSKEIISRATEAKATNQKRGFYPGMRRFLRDIYQGVPSVLLEYQEHRTEILRSINTINTLQDRTTQRTVDKVRDVLSRAHRKAIQHARANAADEIHYADTNDVIDEDTVIPPVFPSRFGFQKRQRAPSHATSTPQSEDDDDLTAEEIRRYKTRQYQPSVPATPATPSHTSHLSHGSIVHLDAARDQR